MVYYLAKVHVCRPRARFFHCPRQVQNCCLDRKGHHQCCCWQCELLLCPGLLPSRRGVTKMACGQILAAPSSLNKDANLWPVMVEGKHAPLSSLSATKQLCWVTRRQSILPGQVQLTELEGWKEASYCSLLHFHNWGDNLKQRARWVDGCYTPLNWVTGRLALLLSWGNPRSSAFAVLARCYLSAGTSHASI